MVARNAFPPRHSTLKSNYYFSFSCTNSKNDRWLVEPMERICLLSIGETCTKIFPCMRDMWTPIRLANPGKCEIRLNCLDPDGWWRFIQGSMCKQGFKGCSHFSASTFAWNCHRFDHRCFVERVWLRISKLPLTAWLRQSTAILRQRSSFIS